MLFERLYEDNVSGKISDERFSRMSRRYEDEQKELTEKIKQLRSEIEKQSSRTMTTDMFISLVRKYTRAKKLTPRMLNELVEKIEVFNAEKVNGVTHSIWKKGEDGRPTIVESEAKVVQLIYRLFLDGKSQAAICRCLENLGIPSPGGKDKWSKTTVTSILQNEKYKGDALLQKSFTVDFLEKRMKPNEGEVPQYYVEGSHPAIVDPDEWDHVQTEFARRKALGRAYSGKSVLSAKLVCEDCGGFFGSKVWHSTDRYRRTIWQCNSKFKVEERCHTPTINTETVQRLFTQAYNRMMENREQIIKDCETMRRALTDFAELDAEIERQLEETQVVAELVKAAVKENASTAQSQEAYLRKYEALTERYEKAAAELERLQNLRTTQSQQDKAMALYIRTLKKQPVVLREWSDTIWTVMVEKAIVHRNGAITFVFKNGTEVKVGE